MKPVILLTLAAFLATTLQAWSINGHLYVASIAERVLEDEAPGTLREAYKMLGYLQSYSQTPESDKDWTYGEVDHALVECSTFADDWKYRGEAWQGYFHYVNINWFEEGEESDYDIRVKDKNITDGTEQIVAWLSGKQGTDYMDSYIYTYLMNKFDNNENVAKSYALRMLVHFVGDIVQPLHSMSRYNTEYPKGDAGANGFKLKTRYGVSSLHSLWDKVLYKERNNIRRPFTEDTWTSFTRTVDRIFEMNAEAVSDPDVYQSTDIESWTQESHEIAKALYAGLTEYESVPQSYIDEHLDTAYQQILIGGYRLAYLLDYIFNILQPTIES